METTSALLEFEEPKNLLELGDDNNLLEFEELKNLLELGEDNSLLELEEANNLPEFDTTKAGTRGEGDGDEDMRRSTLEPFSGSLSPEM